MKGVKCVRHEITIYFMASIWFMGCTHNKTIAPISNVGGDDTIDLKDSASFKIKDQDQENMSKIGNIFYNRKYDTLKKGSYLNTTYRVKKGDTLFYIAWITGNDYQYLAKKNNIFKPYNLNIGQILNVDHEKKIIYGDKLLRSTLVDKTYKTNDTINAEATSSISYVPLKKTNLLSNKKNSLSKKKENIKKIEKISSSSKIKNLSPVDTDNVVTKLIWHWPTNGKIIENFSSIEGGNKGIDISGVQGQPILATANGKVVYTGNALRGYGNLIIIKHSNDYLSAYAHNHNILVREEQEVKAGEKIATMGNTGTNKTRLHFEIRYKGKSVNPLSYLLKR